MSDNPDTSRQDAIRAARKEIVRSSVLALAALGAIAFSCYAWFVSSSSVSATGMSAAIKGNAFELASVGSAGAFDQKLSVADQIQGVSWDAKENGWITQTSQTILWKISDASHLGNTTGSTGIEPGSGGTLQFYVVPQGTGSMKLKASLEFIPMKWDSDSENAKLVENSDTVVEDFLKGHILVRYRVGEDQASTLIDPKNGSFSLTVEGQDPVLVRLEWNWAYLLENAIEEDRVKKLVGTNPEYFLCDDDGSPVHGSISLPEKNSQELRKYSNYYNNADQYIGANAGAILLRLTVNE